MHIYIDNNILIDYEEGKKYLPSTSQLEYVYSYVHLQELQELKFGFEEKKRERLQTIEKLTLCRYATNNDNNHVIISRADPSDIYTLISTPLAKIFSLKLHETTAHWKFDEISESFRKKLNIDKKVINNFTPLKLVEKYGDIILNYIVQTCHSRQEVFLSLFNILDALGFWQDKIKLGSSMNRLYDANHAYFATSCDYFVTDDKNTRNKSNVAYMLCQIKTKAISYDKFVNLIKQNIMTV